MKEKNVHDCIALMEIDKTIHEFTRTYIRLITSYDEDTVEHLISNQQEPIYYNYQMANHGFKSDEIKFDPAKH